MEEQTRRQETCKHQKHDPQQKCAFAKGGCCTYRSWGRREPDRIDELKWCPIG